MSQPSQRQKLEPDDLLAIQAQLSAPEWVAWLDAVDRSALALTHPASRKRIPAPVRDAGPPRRIPSA
jgi:hypothetical protein